MGRRDGRSTRSPTDLQSVSKVLRARCAARHLFLVDCSHRLLQILCTSSSRSIEGQLIHFYRRRLSLSQCLEMAEGVISSQGCHDHLHGTADGSSTKEKTDGSSKSLHGVSSQVRHDHPHGPEDGSSPKELATAEPSNSLFDTPPCASADHAHDTEQILSLTEKTDSPEKALFGALSTLVEFVARKLPPAGSRNLLQEMSTRFSALQPLPQEQPHAEPAANLSDSCSSDGSSRKNGGTPTTQLGETSSSEEDSQCSDMECVDLTVPSDDSEHSEYSPSDGEEESPSISIKRAKPLYSSKKVRLEAKDNVGANDRFPPAKTRGFVKFLCAPAGGLKSNANEVDSAVSRCLHYLDSRMLRWSNLLRLNRVSDWLEMHASFGDGPSSLTNKLYYIQSGLKYLRYLSDDDREQAKCLSAIQELDSWRRRYRPLIRKRRSMLRDTMCKKDDEMTSLKGYADTVNDQSLRGKAWDIVNKGRSRLPIARGEFLYVMRYCLTMLVVKNAKRPGVLAGMKLDEWESRGRGPNGLKLVLVSDHKTACSGSSHVYVEAQDESLLVGYISHIRPCAQNARRTGFVFINFSGTQVKKVSSQVRKIVPAGTKFSATNMRKAYSTCVGQIGSYRKEKQLASLADHSHETQQKYYAARRKRKQTAEAYKTLQKLRNDSVRDPSLDTPAKESPLT